MNKTDTPIVITAIRAQAEIKAAMRVTYRKAGLTKAEAIAAREEEVLREAADELTRLSTLSSRHEMPGWETEMARKAQRAAEEEALGIEYDPSDLDEHARETFPAIAYGVEENHGLRWEGELYADDGALYFVPSDDMISARDTVSVELNSNNDGDWCGRRRPRDPLVTIPNSQIPAELREQLR